MLKKMMIFSIILIISLPIFNIKNDDVKASTNISPTSKYKNSLANSGMQENIVTKDNFLDYFQLVGDSVYDSTQGIVTLTTENKFQMGSITLKQKISAKKSFVLKGKINIGRKDPAHRGADGMGFGFHKGNIDDTGGSAGALGIVGLKDATGFVLDSYQNPGDPEVPYGAFLKTDAAGKRIEENNGISGYQLINSSLYDGQFHDLIIEYNAQAKQFTVNFGGQTWVTAIDHTEPLAFMISASTGTSNNIQQFMLESFTYEVSSAVEVEYQDEEGNTIHDSQYINGNVGDAYDASVLKYQLEIPGYLLDQTKLPNNSLGTITEDVQTVTYTYKKEKVAAEPVNVKYVDENGKEIAESHLLNGNIGDTYESKAKVIEGWKLKTTPSNATGILSDQAQTVVYIYEKEKVAAEPVNVKYVDENGKEIAESHLLNGNIGDTYESKAKVIEGWKLKTTPSNATGILSDQAQTVVYIYEKEKVASSIIVRYLDDNNKELVKSRIISGNVGEEYSTNAEKISGYHLKSTPTNAEGIFMENEQTITYIYEKNTIDLGSSAGNSNDLDNDILVKQNPDENSKQIESTKEDSISKHILPITGDVLWDSIIYGCLGVALLLISFRIFLVSGSYKK
ncbi:MucBP domain-containing protein [Listeria welshimeri]|uniref:MucBP domain-containing protein n=1 Tax=Listeria welshimeri TaxID=1643 RepID=UPI001886CC30|nr:MucBP domain-containing protein [Listeria welshimeri]MBF2509613.1 MucBP domain-containing protein [Listeria welshimeri]MBF2698292.1 MucBP domain-containing protein [Listeria welshimeri]